MPIAPTPNKHTAVAPLPHKPMPVVPPHHKKKRPIGGGDGDGSDWEDLLDDSSNCKVNLQTSREVSADEELSGYTSGLW